MIITSSIYPNLYGVGVDLLTLGAIFAFSVIGAGENRKKVSKEILDLECW